MDRFKGRPCNGVMAADRRKKTKKGREPKKPKPRSSVIEIKCFLLPVIGTIEAHGPLSKDGRFVIKLLFVSGDFN